MLVEDKQFTFALALAAAAQRRTDESGACIPLLDQIQSSLFNLSGKDKHDWSLRIADALMTVAEAHGSGVALLKAQIKKDRLFELPSGTPPFGMLSNCILRLFSLSASRRIRFGNGSEDVFCLWSPDMPILLDCSSGCADQSYHP